MPDPIGLHLEAVFEKGIAQLTTISIHKGEFLYFKCSYHEKS